MTIVVDASVVVAALIDDGADGTWARDGLGSAVLVAPAHVHVEVSNVLRRVVLSGAVGRDAAALAHRDLTHLPLTVFPFEVLANRIWELHPTVTSYDAAYVALAEELEAPLWTLDRRLASSSGPRCTFQVPDG